MCNSNAYLRRAAAAALSPPEFPARAVRSGNPHKPPPGLSCPLGRTAQGSAYDEPARHAADRPRTCIRPPPVCAAVGHSIPRIPDTPRILSSVSRAGGLALPGSVSATSISRRPFFASRNASDTGDFSRPARRFLHRARGPGGRRHFRPLGAVSSTTSGLAGMASLELKAA